jgi:hypothetical protein
VIAQVYAFDWMDIKLVMIGAAGALLATLIGRFFLKWSNGTARLIWSHEQETLTVLQESEKDATFVAHKILIENVGNGKAHKIEIVVPRLAATVKLHRIKSRNALFVSPTKDSSLKVVEDSGINRIQFLNLDVQSIAVISYACDFWRDSTPESVTFDNSFAESGILKPGYFRRRDVIAPIVRQHIWFFIPFLFSVGLLVLSLRLDR